MTQRIPDDLDPEVWNLFDEYVHGALDRRGFLERAARLSLAGLTAGAVLDLLQPRFAAAQKVPKDDPRLSSKSVEVPSPAGYGKLRALLVTPAKMTGKLPGVLVVHENRGLNPHIEDVARRFALERFIVLAPDALAPLGGYPGNEDDARALFAKLDQAKTREDFVAAAGYLKGHPDCSGKIGVVGFCYGGGIASFLATRLPDLAAAVGFYGGNPTPEETAKIKAPLQLHYAENDERINAGVPEFEAALKKSRVKHEIHRYPGTQHGFHNDTTPRYHEASAKLAWKRTLDFFEAHLRR
jgi:carboxymethylenebutenolidase